MVQILRNASYNEHKCGQHTNIYQFMENLEIIRH